MADIGDSEKISLRLVSDGRPMPKGTKIVDQHGRSLTNIVEYSLDQDDVGGQRLRVVVHIHEE